MFLTHQRQKSQQATVSASSIAMTSLSIDPSADQALQRASKNPRRPDDVRHAHQPLPGDEFTRIAIIHPGNSNDDIVISLEPVLFSTPPPYEALSYTWGSKDNPKTVYVKELQGPVIYSATLLVTQNLFQALRSLRYNDKSRTMWIDAICIDQSNDEEKSVQVGRMGEIFRRATRVVVWLGPEENDSNHAMDCMRDLGSQVNVNWDHLTFGPTAAASDQSLGDQYAILPWDQRDLTAVYHFLCRRWFERLWVRQEIFLANDQAVIQCGSRLVPWTQLRAALMAVHHKPKEFFSWEGELGSRLNFLTGFIHQASSLDLRYLRLMCANAMCEDPRDRICAILDMLGDADKAIGIKPDYSKNAMQFYEDVVVRYIRHYDSLCLLSQCHFRAGRGPSWVPDWSETPDSEQIRMGFASSHLRASDPIVEPGILKVVAGVSTLRVTDVERVEIRGSSSRKQVFDSIRWILPKEVLHEQQQIQDLLQSYYTTLSGGAYSEDYEPPDNALPTREECSQIMDLLASGSYTYLSEDFAPGTAGEKVLRAVRGLCDGNSLLKMSNGHIGLGPPSTQPGDEISSILGCETPMVLRPAGNSGFRVVGSCYVPGHSNGEALFGPLPDNIRMIRVQSGDGGDHIAFRDVISGQISFADPRLKSLVDAEVYEELKESPGYRVQLSPDVLRRNGMNVEEITLV